MARAEATQRTRGNALVARLGMQLSLPSHLEMFSGAQWVLRSRTNTYSSIGSCSTSFSRSRPQQVCSRTGPVFFSVTQPAVPFATTTPQCAHGVRRQRPRSRIAQKVASVGARAISDSHKRRAPARLFNVRPSSSGPSALWPRSVPLCRARRLSVIWALT